MATMRNRLSAFFLRSGSLTAAGGAGDEFEAKYARLLRARDTLKKVETSTKLYIKKSKSLAKSAKAVGLAMGTPDADLKRLTEELSPTLEDDSLMKAISGKVLLLDDLVRQKRKLDELKGVRDYHTQRLQQIKGKRAAGKMDDVQLHVEEAKWQAKLEHSQKEYEELLQEFTEALDFIDAQTKVDGPWSLVGVELEVFRTNQAKLFKSVDGMFVGAPAGTYTRDPVAEKAAVEAQKALEVTLNEADSKPGSHLSSAQVAPTAAADSVSPQKKDQAAQPGRPKPPKPPGAESDDDDDDDDVEL